MYPQVVPIDIANDTVLPSDYKKDEDPTTYTSEKTGRGPLTGDWQVVTRILARIIADAIIL